MSYLNTIPLVKVQPCLAEPGKVIVVGKPDRLLAEVIPYLAALPGVIAYNPQTLTLTFRRPRGFMTLYPDKVYITQLADAEEGLQLLAALADAINATWDARHELSARIDSRKAPRPLDIYVLLPQSNCGRCGEATCMAFACALLLQNRALRDCLPLADDELMADRLSTLQGMLL
jgi:ArsR family metal-binding transcriptional regulator